MSTGIKDDSRPSTPCSACGTGHAREDMSEDATRVYDALFPRVLGWREDDDCGMAELMASVATAAAEALRTP